LRNDTQTNLERRIKIDNEQHSSINMPLGLCQMKNSEILGNTYESEQQHTSKHASFFRNFAKLSSTKNCKQCYFSNLIRFEKKAY